MPEESLKFAPGEDSESSIGDTAEDYEEEEKDAVLDTFLDTLLGPRGDAWAAEVKRALSIFVQARVARGDGRAMALDEGKLVLKGLVEAKKVMKRL